MNHRVESAGKRTAVEKQTYLWPAGAPVIFVYEESFSLDARFSSEFLLLDLFFFFLTWKSWKRLLDDDGYDRQTLITTGILPFVVQPRLSSLFESNTSRIQSLSYDVVDEEVLHRLLYAGDYEGGRNPRYVVGHCVGHFGFSVFFVWCVILRASISDPFLSLCCCCIFLLFIYY